MKKFEITVKFSESSIIPISQKIVSYLEDKIIEEIFKRNSLLVDTKWHWLYSFYLVDATEFKMNKYDIVIYNKSKVTTEDTFVGGAMCPNTLVKNNNPLNREFIRLLLESFKLFLAQEYKSINEEKFDSFIRTIDFNYLYALPFPAPKEEQRFSVGYGNMGEVEAE